MRRTAAESRNDARGYRLADAKGIAHGKHHIAHPQLVAVGEGKRGKMVRLNLDDRHVGLRVAADDLGDVFAVVGQADLQLVRPLNDMVVGQDISIGTNDEPGAEALAHLLQLMRQGWAAKEEGL